jgi:hypothetical protein
MKEKGYVQMWLRKETREALKSLKRGDDTYDLVIEMLLIRAFEMRAEDFAAQNIDHVDDTDEEAEG